MADKNPDIDPVDGSEEENKKEDGPRFTSKQKAAAAAVGVAGLGAAGTTLALTGTGAVIGTGITSGVAGLTSAATASAAATTGTLAATGSALGAALMAPIAGLSIGVPVVAPVVVGIAILVYLLVKKHQKNKELFEVMSQAVELIMRIEKCEMLMSEILMQTGYISNNTTLNDLLADLMAEILKICPTSVIEEFQKLLDNGKVDDKGKYEKSDQEKDEEKSKSLNVSIRKEYSDRKTKHWRFGLKAIRRFTATTFFRKHQYTKIVNKLTMINAFFTTLFAEFSLTTMVLDIDIPKKGPAVKGLIDSLRLGSKLLHGRNKDLLEKGEAVVRRVHNRQEELLGELSKYVDPTYTKGNSFDKISDEIKTTISKEALTTSNFREGQKLGGGRHTKKRNKKQINKKI